MHGNINKKFKFKSLNTSVKRLILFLIINQLDAQNLSYNKFILRLYMFRAPCAHRAHVTVPCTGRPPIGVMIPEAV